MKFSIKVFALMFAGAVIATPSLAAEPASKKTNQAAANSQYPNSGKVLSTIETDMYTYIEVSGKSDKDKDDSIWLAVGSTKVAKGDSVRYGSGSVMTNFHSKSLNRTFPAITFIDKVQVVKEGS